MVTNILRRIGGLEACASSNRYTNTYPTSNNSISTSSASAWPKQSNYSQYTSNIVACEQNMTTYWLIALNRVDFTCTGKKSFYSAAIDCDVSYLIRGAPYSSLPSLIPSPAHHCECAYKGGGEITSFDLT